MVKCILVGQLFIHCADQAFQINMVVGVGKVLQMQPETFNRIEKRAVFGQPKHQQVIFQRRECGFGGSVGVIGSIIHHQYQPLVGIDSEGQMLQKGDTGFAVLLATLLPGDVARRPVVSAEDIDIPFIFCR